MKITQKDVDRAWNAYADEAIRYPLSIKASASLKKYQHLQKRLEAQKKGRKK